MAVIVIVGTAKGAAILRADDARRDWQVDALALKGWSVTAATRDARGRTYLGVTHDVYGATVMASDDLQDWQQCEGTLQYEDGLPGNEQHNRVIGAMDPMGRFEEPGRYVDQIWKLLAVGDTLYAGVSEAGLFRSDDGAKSFRVCEGINEHPDRASWFPGFGGLCAHSILVDAENPQRIWVGISAAGLFRSEDGGETFVSANEGVSRHEGWCVHSVALDPNHPGVIYRQDHRGVYRTADGGDSWQEIQDGLPIVELSDGRRCTFGFPVAVDPNTSSALVVPMAGDNFRYPIDGSLAVYRTDDAGASWQRKDAGLPDNTFSNVLRGAMAVDGLDPCGVYFGTTSGAVFASADRGESWSTIPVTLPKVQCVEAFAV